jgi:hypothetical protein
VWTGNTSILATKTAFQLNWELCGGEKIASRKEAEFSEEDIGFDIIASFQRSQRTVREGVQ